MQTLRDQRHLAFAAFVQDDAELVSRGPSDDVVVAQRPREPLAGGDDHFIGAIETIGLVDHGELVDRGDDKGARPFAGRRARDDLLQFLAQTRTVQVARQLVARREIVETRQRGLLFGHLTENSGEALGAAVCARQPHGRHFEPFARRERGGFELEFQLAVLRAEILDEDSAACCARPSPSRCGTSRPMTCDRRRGGCAEPTRRHPTRARLPRSPNRTPRPWRP